MLNGKICCARTHFNRIMLAYIEKPCPNFNQSNLFGQVFFHITNAIRDCTVKSARNAPIHRRTRRITFGELRKFSLEVRAPPRRGEWIFEGDLGVSDLRATAGRAWTPLSGPHVSSKKENDKNIYVPRKLRRRGPKPTACTVETPYTS